MSTARYQYEYRQSASKRHRLVGEARQQLVIDPQGKIDFVIWVKN